MSPKTKSICRKCYERTGGCCTAKEDAGFFPLTRNDLARITEHTRLDPEYFSIEEEVDQLEALKIAGLSPFFELSMTGATRTRLKMKPMDHPKVGERQRCIFLNTKRGCVLPSEVKPIICRSAPLWFDVGDDGIIPGSLYSTERCLLVRSCKSTKEILRAIGFSDRTYSRLAEQAMADVESHIRLMSGMVECHAWT